MGVEKRAILRSSRGGRQQVPSHPTHKAVAESVVFTTRQLTQKHHSTNVPNTLILRSYIDHVNCKTYTASILTHWKFISFFNNNNNRTLLVNAGAVIKFKLPTLPQTAGGDDVFGNQPSATPVQRLLLVLHSLRFLRIFIALWNLLVIFLMIV